MVCAAAILHEKFIPLTDSVFELAMVKSRTVLFDMVLVPPDERIPEISPLVAVDALVRFATVFPDMVVVPVLVAVMPYTL